MDILKSGPHSKTIANPTNRHCRTVVQSGAVQKLQTKMILPTMLRACPNGFIGEGVFGRCHKAYLQGTIVCVKELKVHTPSSKSVLLQEAEMLSRMCHPSLCWLMAIQIYAFPFQLVLPYYCIEGASVTYHDVLFNKEKLQVPKFQHPQLSLQFWMPLLRDVADGLQHIHALELVYRDNNRVEQVGKEIRPPAW